MKEINAKWHFYLIPFVALMASPEASSTKCQDSNNSSQEILVPGNNAEQEPFIFPAESYEEVKFISMNIKNEPLDCVLRALFVKKLSKLIIATDVLPQLITFSAKNLC